VVLLEPERDDYLMAFTNIFGFSERRAVCEHAYHSTRRYLLAHHDALSEVFARHGVILRRDVLLEERDLWEQVGLSRAGRRQPATVPAPPSRPLRSPPSRPSPAAAGSSASVVQRLDDTLSRLERLVERQLEPIEEAEEAVEQRQGVGRATWNVEIHG
jgi:NTE family protein